MDEQYLHRDILKVFPWIKPRTLISWSERGLVKPLGKAYGRGSARVYSYSNLVEIGIISELLSFGMPFTIIGNIMTSKFDTVFWFCRELVNAKVPMNQGPPWGAIYGFGTLDEFAIEGRKTTSAIIIKLEGIKRFVDGQIRNLNR